MAASLLQHYSISAIIVGADRVVRNGDTANKIGTYQLAILAKYHGVKFIVAAPTTSIDMVTEDGTGIVIEQRAWHEVCKITGPRVNEVERGRMSLDTGHVCTISTAARGIGVYNPSFDVTPKELIDVIVTEKGACVKNEKGEFELGKLFV